jgi:hypothetical protein
MLRTNLSQEYDCPHGSDSDINEPNLVHHGQKFYCHWCGGEHIAGIDVQVSTIRDWRDYPELPQSAEELQALINEDDTPKITDQELQALRKKVATYEARDALGLVPQPPGALGPDGKEWAKTAAGYAHVEAMRPRADGLQSVGPYWYGWALRGAFVAGAEWQEARNLPAATPSYALLTIAEARKVFLVATGEEHEGEATYTRYDDAPPPLCDSECLYTAAPPPAAQVDALTQAARDVLAERQRQINAEGWTPEHDDVHQLGELSQAAACYASQAFGQYGLSKFWPWAAKWWKPSKDPRRNLEKAGALILAEMERIDRAARKQGGA